MSPGNRPRMVAENSVSVLCVDTELLDFLLNWGAGNGVVVDEINADEEGEWVDGLLRSETILSLSPQSIQTLMAVVEPVDIKANETVFNQGDAPDYYYIVSRGHCVVTRRAERKNGPVELARLGPGDAFAEEALIANSARSATVRMFEDGLLLRLDQRNFKKLLEQSLVKTINTERANRLRSKGAVVLDLRPVAEFSRDGSGINIPFSELRNRINSLDKKEKYIVVSDDNNLSAVGAFLLSKKRFKVYLLKAAEKEMKSAVANVQTRQFEMTVSQLKQQLSQTNAWCREKEKTHAASKGRIQLLESGLKETEARARKAILEASVLKNRSESVLHDRVNALVCELDKQLQSSRGLSVDNESLKVELRSVLDKMEQVQSKVKFKSAEASEAQGRATSLNEQVRLLEGRLSDLQQGHEKVLVEKQQLNHQLNEASQKAEQKSDELNVVQKKLQLAYEHAENIEKKLQLLQTTHTELETNYQQNMAEKLSLNNLLNEAIQTAEQQGVELDELQTQLQGVSDEAAQTRQSLQLSQQQLAEVEGSLKLSRNVGQQAKQQLRQQEKLHADQQRTIALLTEDLRLQAQVTQQYNSLQYQLESTEVTLAKKESDFSQLESSYKQRVERLEIELGQAATESDKVSEQAAKQVLQNQVLSERLSMLQGDNKRSGLMVKSLLFVLLLLVASIGAAYYMKIDIHGQASILMEQAAPQVNKLFDGIPE